MKPISQEQATTFGDWAYLAIAKHFQKVVKHEEGVLKDQDPEELHEMRVGMRRLRATIKGFAPALILPKGARRKNLAKVFRQLGELRDLDVLEAAIKEEYYPLLPTAEQKKLDKALKELANRRHTAFKKVKNTLKHKHYIQLKTKMQAWLDKPVYQDIAALGMERILPDLLLPQVSNLLAYPGWLIGVKVEAGEVQFPDKLDKEAVAEILDSQEEILHNLRKQAKQTRYQLELFTELYGQEYQNYTERVKSIQSILGDIQDSFVLAEFLEGMFSHDLEEKLPTLVENLQTRRYQKWQDWRELQKYFLDSQHRQDFRFTIHGFAAAVQDNQDSQQPEEVRN